MPTEIEKLKTQQNELAEALRSTRFHVCRQRLDEACAQIDCALANLDSEPVEQPEISELLRKLSDAIKTNWIENRDDYNLGLTIATETLESQISVQKAITNHRRNK